MSGGAAYTVGVFHILTMYSTASDKNKCPNKLSAPAVELHHTNMSQNLLQGGARGFGEVGREHSE